MECGGSSVNPHFFKTNKMTSENYRQLLNNEFETKEMSKEDFDNTLMQFAMLYHTEQLKLYNVSGRSEQLCGNLDENYNCKKMCLTRCVDGNKFYK